MRRRATSLDSAAVLGVLIMTLGRACSGPSTSSALAAGKLEKTGLVVGHLAGLWRSPPEDIPCPCTMAGGDLGDEDDGAVICGPLVAEIASIRSPRPPVSRRAVHQRPARPAAPLPCSGAPPAMSGVARADATPPPWAQPPRT